MKTDYSTCLALTPSGFGQYTVTYTTPIRGDYWVAKITDMTLIDAVKRPERKITAVKRLLCAVKRNGSHFSKYGKIITE